MKYLCLSLAACVTLTLTSCFFNNDGGGSSNVAPVLSAVGSQLAEEGAATVVNLSATDADPQDVVSFSISPNFSFATLTDHGNGTAELLLMPSPGDAGIFDFTVTARDDAAQSLEHQQDFKVVVYEAGSPPLLGTVRDSLTMMPIVGALVTLQATPNQVTTDENGEFIMFSSPDPNQVFVGAMPGYYNASITTGLPAMGMEIQLDPVPLGNNIGYAFLDPNFCAICHPHQKAQWETSTMANAGVNEWVHDFYAGNGTPGGMGGFVYTRDSIFATENPDAECAACHQPELWMANGFSGRMQGPGDAVYPSGGAVHGVSCETCHKMASVDVTKLNFPGIFPGQVTMNLPDFGQVQYGLLPDADFSLANTMMPSYNPQLAAEVCATCHQDNGDIHGDHTFLGVVSEPTYNEWKESPYGDPESPMFKSCIDCHMPPSGEKNICENISINRNPATIRTHVIEGTTPAFLENSVDMTIQANLVGTQINVSVNITNSMAGHHVPTGIPIRNLVLLVEAWEDGQDPLTNPLTFKGTQTVHSLGGVGDPAQGYYSGLPGKLYAKVDHDQNMQGPVFFTEATGILFDTRIPALASDVTNYSFEIPSTGSGIIHVRARLIYRRAFRSIVDAKGWTNDGHGNKLADVSGPHYGHLMEIATDNINF